jgi:uncharacterized membrane protein (UPF0127 family)
LQIVNDKEVVAEFMIKIAKTIHDRQTGLMFVTELPENQGMIFENEREQQTGMWMKNTKISLDMIFIDKNNKIVAIKSRAVPESLDIISTDAKVLKVLEINGGLSEKLGIKIGYYIKY